MMTRFAAPLHRQRGAALLLAMIIVTLITTLAVSIVWQQWRAVQVETAERARSQSAWILAGALDWASLILREDARPQAGKSDADHLGEPWAVPLAEARLSTFLAADKQTTDDGGPEAFLSGAITDATSRYNLTNLVTREGEIVKDELAALQRLCSNLNVAVGVADLIANGMSAAKIPDGKPGALADPPLLPTRISQLTWLQVDPQALQRLEPYLVFLPAGTKVNINTAPREVLAAVIPNFNIGDAERVVQVRQRTPVLNAKAMTDLLNGIPAPGVDYKSSYFEIRGRLRLSDRVLEQRSLVRRDGIRPVTIISTERVSSTETGS